jgi:hypothetical protein
MTGRLINHHEVRGSPALWWPPLYLSFWLPFQANTGPACNGCSCVPATNTNHTLPLSEIRASAISLFGRVTVWETPRNTLLRLGQRRLRRISLIRPISGDTERLSFAPIPNFQARACRTAISEKNKGCAVVGKKAPPPTSEGQRRQQSRREGEPPPVHHPPALRGGGKRTLILVCVHLRFTYLSQSADQTVCPSWCLPRTRTPARPSRGAFPPWCPARSRLPRTDCIGANFCQRGPMVNSGLHDRGLQRGMGWSRYNKKQSELSRRCALIAVVSSAARILFDFNT